MRRTLCVGLLVGALAVTACTSGMVLGAGMQCTGSTLRLTQVTGTCTRTLETLSEPQSEQFAVQTADIAPQATLDFTLSVDSGQAVIAFVDVDGNTQRFEAAPRAPATGSVRVRLDAFNQVKFEVAPVGGEAAGVAYEVSFVCDCMP